MVEYVRSVVACAGGAIIACGLVTFAQAPSQPSLPLAPLGRAGNAVIPAQEGWWRNADGTATFLLGYFNRNETVLEIPIGPNNRIEPGGPDMGQPTTFLPHRQSGMFAIKVPKDFGSKRLTWTLTANGQTVSIPLWLNPPYVVDPFRNASNGNTPPRIKFDPAGPEHVAGPTAIATKVDASTNVPLSLPLWFVDAAETVGHPAAEGGRGRGSAVKVSWSKYRGPGAVKFEPQSQAFAELQGKAVATATFSSPGSYVIRAQVNDASGEGGGGDQCCWTSAHVAVQVK